MVRSSTCERVKEKRLSWAKECLASEVRTNFTRALTFTGLFPRQRLAILRAQPGDKLEVLARVLPLGIWSEAPGVDEVRTRLSDEEREALEQLEAAAARLRDEHFSANVQRIARGNTAEFRQQFRAARRECAPIVKEIAAKWNCTFASAGAGEWGLIHERSWGRITVSLDLLRNLDMAYSITVSDRSLHSRYMFHDHYLGALGIGTSEWANESAEECLETLTQAAKFIRWHVDECDAIMESAL